MYWTVRSRLRALVAAEAGMRIAGTILGMKTGDGRTGKLRRGKLEISEVI